MQYSYPTAASALIALRLIALGDVAVAQDVPGITTPGKGCAKFLASSQKARMQWELERRFQEFEAGAGARPRVK